MLTIRSMKAKKKLKAKAHKMGKVKKAKKVEKVKAKKLEKAKNELRKLVVATHSLFTPTSAPKPVVRAGMLFF